VRQCGTEGDAEIARTDIARLDNAASDQTEVLEHGRGVQKVEIPMGPLGRMGIPWEWE